MSLNEFLVWLAGIGSVLAISWLFEYFKLFQNLEPQKKQLVFFVVCSIVAVGAQYVNANLSAKVIEQIAPYFKVIFAVFGYLFLGDKFHETTKLDKQ
jgi:hypothetical protein